MVGWSTRFSRRNEQSLRSLDGYRLISKYLRSGHIRASAAVVQAVLELACQAGHRAPSDGERAGDDASSLSSLATSTMSSSSSTTGASEVATSSSAGSEHEAAGEGAPAAFAATDHLLVKNIDALRCRARGACHACDAALERANARNARARGCRHIALDWRIWDQAPVPVQILVARSLLKLVSARNPWAWFNLAQFRAAGALALLLASMHEHAFVPTKTADLLSRLIAAVMHQPPRVDELSEGAYARASACSIACARARDRVRPCRARSQC